MTIEEEDCEAAYDEGFANGRRFGRADISELLEALEEVLDSQGALTNPSEFPNCLNISEERGLEILALIAKARGEA